MSDIIDAKKTILEAFSTEHNFRDVGIKDGLERLLLSRLTQQEVKDWIRNYAAPYKELMAYYRCAMMEVETKFNVLNEELSLQYDRNPIETIKTRLKSPESILEKLQRKGLPLTVESIEKNLNDIAGVRVICSHPADIYQLAEAFLKQDDITLLQRKDYIAEPKPIEKKPIVSKASRLVSELIAAAERLLRICKGMEGKPNKVLQGFVRDINKLSDDMEKYT